jgi:hypothetical protein
MEILDSNTAASSAKRIFSCEGVVQRRSKTRQVHANVKTKKKQKKVNANRPSIHLPAHVPVAKYVRTDSAVQGSDAVQIVKPKIMQLGGRIHFCPALEEAGYCILNEARAKRASQTIE